MINEYFDDLNKHLTTVMVKDNKKNVTYNITKDEITNKYIVDYHERKVIDSSEEMDAFFKKLISYYNSIDPKDFWPNLDEYPDLFILWEMHLANAEKDGTGKYPNNWELIMEELKKMIK